MSLLLIGVALSLLVVMAGALFSPEGQRFDAGAWFSAGFLCLLALGFAGGGLWLAYRLVVRRQVDW